MPVPSRVWDEAMSAARVDVHRAADGARLYRVSSLTNSKKLFFTAEELADLIRQAETVLKAPAHVRAT
jgi:hypothetical protein